MDIKGIQAWVALGTLVIVWTFTAGVIWTRLNNLIVTNAKTAKDQADEVGRNGAAEREKLRIDINGLGGRLQRQESACSGLDGRMDSAERQLGQQVQQSLDIQHRLGKVEAGVEGINSHLTEFKLELFQNLGDIKSTIQNEQATTRQMITDRDANLRERVARVEQQQGIPHKDR